MTTSLKISETCLLRKGFGRRWEFSAVVSAEGMDLRVCFPINAKSGGFVQARFSGLMRRAIRQMQSVIVRGSPMPGYWSVYRV